MEGSDEVERERRIIRERDRCSSLAAVLGLRVGMSDAAGLGNRSSDWRKKNNEQMDEGVDHHHRHSGIRFVAPAQRHAGEDQVILAGRHALYQAARARNPNRWSGATRNWTPVGAVTLNPEREAVAASLRDAANLEPNIRFAA